jgi:ABC-type ATPase involved in cell division
MIENQIEKLSRTITADFQEFWCQKIGKTNKIGIEFELKHHDEKVKEKAGKPYLAFWIKDGQEKLYPKQRSKGVRWFSSFYLQLKASSKNTEKIERVFLIDEPGGSLHAKAQEDVIKVFEELKDKIQVVYTTHSPYLIKLETLYRLLAVQRANDEDDKSETQILDIHRLGSASTDTLSPIYTLMGADFSHQQVIKNKNNILLEEISAFYYISAFWKLCNSSINVSFLPATGVHNVPQLAYLFLGWNLDFIIVVDDNKAGRQIYTRLKRELFEDDDSKTEKKLLKIKNCAGVEDLFTKTDFKKHVLEDNSASYPGSNSEYMKRKQKAIIATKFMLKVKENNLNINDLQQSSQDRIKKLVQSIESRLC